MRGREKTRDREDVWDRSHMAGDPHREPARQGVAYFCEEPLHAALLIPQVAALALIELAVEASAGSAEVFGHVSDCLVFSFKCLPLLQLLGEKNTCYLFNYTPRNTSLALSHKYQGTTQSLTHRGTSCLLLKMPFALQRSSTVVTGNAENVQVSCFKRVRG